MIVLLWLAAIVGANLSVAHFGPTVSIYNAFLLIGLSLTTRDYLHRAWAGKNLKVKMGLLITAGGLISWFTQPATGQIALGSIIAFIAAEIVDSVVYHRTRSINKSNTVSAFVDSVLFPTIAFGGFPVLIILGQWVAKFAGGAVWAFLLRRKLWVAIFALLGLSSTQAQNVQVHQNEHGGYVTAEIFHPGQLEVYAFVDRYLYGSEVVYGEVALYRNFGDVAVTAQLETGSSRFFEIDTVLLGGVRFSGFEVLGRSDEKMQLTYVWFHRHGAFQFNGYVDFWGWDDWELVAQPQVWYWVSDWLALGGEVFAQYEDEWSFTPSVAIKVQYDF
jgi:hypothetical protein